mgnify:CR=1 FL=1
MTFVVYDKNYKSCLLIINEHLAVSVCLKCCVNICSWIIVIWGRGQIMFYWILQWVWWQHLEGCIHSIWKLCDQVCRLWNSWLLFVFTSSPFLQKNRFEKKSLTIIIITDSSFIPKSFSKSRGSLRQMHSCQLSCIWQESQDFPHLVPISCKTAWISHFFRIFSNTSGNFWTLCKTEIIALISQ